MTNANNIMRALLVYAIVLPLAFWIGYVLVSNSNANVAPDNTLAAYYTSDTLLVFGLTFGVLCTPLLLKWHYHLLFLSWNTTFVVFFLPGRPNMWLLMAFLSLLLVVLQRTLIRDHRFLSAPSIVAPLVFICVVVAVTAHLTGGIGLSAFGSSAVGGKRYLMLFGAAAGFLAMISTRIKPEKAKLFMGLFFLGQLANAIGTFAPIMPKFLHFLFLAFPIEGAGMAVLQGGAIEDIDALRPWGLTNACLSVCFYLLARFGVRGLLDLSHQWRLLLFGAMALASLFGGYRSYLILLAGTCALLFVLEGLVRSRYMIMVVMVTLVSAALIIPFASKLPMSIQRSLSFLPLDISPVARASAQGSSEWRIQMWQSLLPDVPHYLILGKGLAMDPKEVQAIQQTAFNAAQGASGASLAADYHNGPLSVLIPFGIFGALGFLWFVAAGMRALHYNWKYGDPELKGYNALLYAFFMAKIALFMLVFGGFYGDLPTFAGILGLSVALNGGIRQPEHRRYTIARPVALSLGSPVRPTPSFSR